MSLRADAIPADTAASPASPGLVAVCRTATIDESGNAAFNDVPPGDYTLQPGLPESTARLVTFCSKKGEPGVEYPSSVEHSEYAPPNLYDVKISLAANANILCDVFAVPAPSGTSV